MTGCGAELSFAEQRANDRFPPFQHLPAWAPSLRFRPLDYGFSPNRRAIIASTLRFGKVRAIRFATGLGVTV